MGKNIEELFDFWEFFIFIHFLGNLVSVWHDKFDEFWKPLWLVVCSE